MSDTFLKPFSQNHSIKEAVISIFLVNPIIKPERFQQLIEGGLKDDFHLYENIGAFNIPVKYLANSVLTQPEPLQNIGFKLLGFKNGKIGKMLQGASELNRTYISYHNLLYERWNEYLNDYLRYLEIVSEFQPDIFIKAVSVHYVDEFIWISGSQMDLNKVFNDKAKYMSKAFLESSNVANFIYSTEKSEQDSGLLIERLEIKVNNKTQKNITISHNITKQFDDFKNLSSLLTTEKSFFTDSLQNLHNYNKQILNDILIEDVKTLIHLPSDL